MKIAKILILKNLGIKNKVFYKYIIKKKCFYLQIADIKLMQIKLSNSIKLIKSFCLI